MRFRKKLHPRKNLLQKNISIVCFQYQTDLWKTVTTTIYILIHTTHAYVTRCSEPCGVYILLFLAVRVWRRNWAEYHSPGRIDVGDVLKASVPAICDRYFKWLVW